jgi:lipid II:glycine glycyltransferase (peptidoglycan interpeptide bridge formation enzyme)
MISWCKYNADFHGDWDAQVNLLPGSNFFQTIGWGRVKEVLGWRIQQMVATDQGVIVSMALVLFKRQPFYGVSAWLPGGLSGEPAAWGDPFHLALKRELSAIWLYIRTNQLGFERSDQLVKFMGSAGWAQPTSRLGSGLSLMYNTKLGEADRLAAMSMTWRQNVKRSRKHELRFERWVEPDASAIIKIYREMESLKGLALQVTQRELEAIFQQLKGSMVLYKCETAQGEVIAIRAYALFNNHAFELLAAAAPVARKLHASHGLLWSVLNDCHHNNIEQYDLGGVDPIKNKGVYDFKQDIGSDLINYLGEWERASSPIIKALVNLVIKVKKKS